MLLCADAAAASAGLAGGLLACPSCGTGRLARWGHGRERVIRLLDGAATRLRPDRARCRSCRRTHILLPSWCVPRRADAIQVIAAGLAAALGGSGCGRIAAGLGVPPSTVRGWLRRLRSRAEEMRCFAMAQLGAIGGTDPALPALGSSPLHDALNAVAAAAQAAITGYGFGPADLWPLLGRFGLARHLMPARPAEHPAPAWALPRPPPGRDVHHDHRGVTLAEHRDTVNAMPPP